MRPNPAINKVMRLFSVVCDASDCYSHCIAANRRRFSNYVIAFN